MCVCVCVCVYERGGMILCREGFCFLFYFILFVVDGF